MKRFLITFLVVLLLTSDVNGQTDKNGVTSAVKKVSITVVASSGRPVNQNEFITIESNEEETSWQYFSSLGTMTAEGNIGITAQELSSSLERVFSVNSPNQSALSEREKPLVFFSMLYFLDGKPTAQTTISKEIHEAIKKDDTFSFLFSNIKKQVFGKKPTMPKLWQNLNALKGGDVTIPNSPETIESPNPPASVVSPPWKK